MAKILQAFDKYWHITELNSNFKTEIIGGVTTFMAMAYILIVNPSLTANPTGGAPGFEALYIGTALSAIVGTSMMAFYSKLPFAQAPGMGLNAYFAFTVIGAKMGEHSLTYANALFIVMISGVIFLFLTIFGVREKIVDSVPHCIKTSITAGIGLFIAFVGLQNAAIINPDASVLVGFATLNAVDHEFEEIWPTLVVLLTFLIICSLSYAGVRGAILWGIVIGTILHYIVGYAGGFVSSKNEKQLLRLAATFQKNTYDNPPFNTTEAFKHFKDTYKGLAIDPSESVTITDPGTAFKLWGQQSAVMVFREGWRDLIAKDRWFSDLLNIIAMVLAFAMVDMFDTIGTLLGTAKRAGLVDEDGKLPNIGQALLCDSVATCTGTLCGVSTVTTFVESSAGVNEGARTGFASLITAICFFICLFLTPVAQVIPSTATAPALMYVGVLMLSSISDLDFSDVSVAAPAFQTIVFMPFSYNISIGIALGLLTFTFMKLINGIIYLCKAACCKDKVDQMDSADEKALDAEMDQISDEHSSSSSSSSKDQSAHASNKSHEENYMGHAAVRHATNKELGIKELKSIHPATIVIDILFLIYFFCARK